MIPFGLDLPAAPPSHIKSNCSVGGFRSGSTWRISLHIGLPELSATTLLLDEAARFPPAALQAVLMAAADRAARCVVASTVHGYEGTGSGLMRLVEQLQLEARLFGGVGEDR